MVGPLIPPSCGGMLDFIGSFIPEGIPAFNPAEVGIMSEDVPEFGIMSGRPCIPPPDGGVADAGGLLDPL